MFDAELFGITSHDLLASAHALVAPMLGFLFLFLLALPLKKLPIVDIGNYRPPASLLPIFAIGSLFVVTFCLTAALMLARWSSYPSSEEFEKTFHIVRTVVAPINRLLSASLTVTGYNGLSDFRMFVNGYRVFGSSSNCIMDYQCRPAGDRAAAQAYQTVRSLSDREASIYNIYQLYDLPHTEDISGLLVAGKNVIDIHSENSGLGDCGLRVALELKTDAKPSSVYDIEISSNTGKPDGTTQPLKAQEVFFSGGSPASSEPSVKDLEVPIYRTRPFNGSYRVCQRIRIELELTNEQLVTLDDKWKEWARARRRMIVCDTTGSTSGTCAPQ